MAIKIYEDSTTKELVIDRGATEDRYGVFSEIRRVNHNDLELSLSAISTNLALLVPTAFGDLQNEAGTPYASFAALKTALDGFFDATV